MRFVFIFGLFVALSVAQDSKLTSTSVTASSTSPSTAKSSPMSTSIEGVGTVSSTVPTSTIQSGGGTVSVSSTVAVGSTVSASSTVAG
ncbi:hypothetical protein GCK32_013916, partial [Trichostrongylus colubriformis]